MVMVNMSSWKVVSFFLLTVVSMSRTVISSEMTDVTTATYAVTEFTPTEHLIFQWALKNYSLLPHTEPGCFRSPYFHTKSNDVQWLLKSCSNQDANSCSGMIKLISHSPKGLDNIGFAIDGQITLSKADIFLVEEKFSKKVRIGEESPFVFMVHVRTIPNWFNSADEMNIRLNVNVKRTITKIIDLTEPLEQKTIQEPQKGKLNDDFGRLLEEKKYCDVEIIVGDEKLSAHEIILATRSPVLADLFERTERNHTGKLRVTIENMEPAVMKAILEYLYTDDITNLDKFPSIFGLLSAADEFKLLRLKIMCETVLHERLDANSAADILVLSDRYNLSKLKKHAMEFITNRFEDVAKTEGYRKVKDKSPALLMEILFSTTDKHL